MQTWQRRTLGILTLGGGALGITLSLQQLPATSQPIALILLGISVVAFAWGVWIGVRVLEGDPRAAERALPYWLIQIPVFSSPIASYFFAGGFYSVVMVNLLPLGFDGVAILGSSFRLSLFTPGTPWMIGVNLFAALMVAWLHHVAKAQSSDEVPSPDRDAPLAPGGEEA